MELPTDYNLLNGTQRRTVREKYIKLQNGKCFYCKQLLCENPPQIITEKRINLSLFPPNFLKYPVHLQHDHNTGMTEGAVHAYCNAVMWQYENR
jgi:hypothetical protein